MEGGRRGCAGNGKEKMGSGWYREEEGQFILFISLIRKERPERGSLERVGKWMAMGRVLWQTKMRKLELMEKEGGDRQPLVCERRPAH